MLRKRTGALSKKGAPEERLTGVSADTVQDQLLIDLSCLRRKNLARRISKVVYRGEVPGNGPGYIVLAELASPEDDGG
jgi:hypothetical protein